MLWPSRVGFICCIPRRRSETLSGRSWRTMACQVVTQKLHRILHLMVAIPGTIPCPCTVHRMFEQFNREDFASLDFLSLRPHLKANLNISNFATERKMSKRLSNKTKTSSASRGSLSAIDESQPNGTQVPDTVEKRRMQNRLAQRNHRKLTKLLFLYIHG